MPRAAKPRGLSAKRGGIPSLVLKWIARRCASTRTADKRHRIATTSLRPPRRACVSRAFATMDRTCRSPGETDHAGTGVDRRMRADVAVELGAHRPAAEPREIGAGRHQDAVGV